MALLLRFFNFFSIQIFKKSVLQNEYFDFYIKEWSKIKNFKILIPKIDFEEHFGDIFCKNFIQ